MWRVTLSVWLSIVIVIYGSWEVYRFSKWQKLANSPCGNVNLTTIYHANSGGQMFHYFDDGKRLWQIKTIKPPVSDGAKPVVEMVLEFERSPENCAIWKMEQGIKD